MELLSTSSLAKAIGIHSAELSKQLESMGWILNQQDKKILTEIGVKKGGQIRTSSKFGEYIVWPDNIRDEITQQPKYKRPLINSTSIGKHFDVSSQRINLLLNELGWIEKTLAGWRITKFGQSIGGKQLEHETSGATYVLWPDIVLQNKDLIESFQQAPVNDFVKNIILPTNEDCENDLNDFRKKYKANYRTKDGHYVRSKAELTIDDSLYLWGVAHAYEKKIPNTDQNLVCDFHIPSGNGRSQAVFIEYWGLENDDQYSKRKHEKIKIYKDLELNLIELTDSDIKNIDDSLPKFLLKYGIKIGL